MKDILLVGGSGGIGRAVGENLAAHGYRVFSCDITDAVCAHENIVLVHMDIRSMDSIQAAYAQVSAASEGLDAVISLAGVYIMDSLVEVDENELQHIMDANLMGVYRVNKAFLPLMGRGGRVIITTSELEGLRPFPFNGIYAMTKTALGCYADSLRLELQLLGLKVITIRPGAYDTQLSCSASSQMRRMCGKTALYKMGTKKFACIIDSQMGTAKDPAKLAKVFHRAVSARHPRLTYAKNTNVTIRLYAALPRRLQAWLIRMILKED